MRERESERLKCYKQNNYGTYDMNLFVFLRRRDGSVIVITERTSIFSEIGDSRKQIV